MNKEHRDTQNKIDAPNALIVTQNQSGGNNTVINPKVDIPLPTIKLVGVSLRNEVVKEISTRPARKKIALPSDKYKYDSLYKTVFTISFACQISINEIALRIKRNDVVYLNVTHNGLMMSKTARDQMATIFIVSHPENGNYAFEVYTEREFSDILTDVDYLK